MKVWAKVWESIDDLNDSFLLLCPRFSCGETELKTISPESCNYHQPGPGVSHVESSKYFYVDILFSPLNYLNFLWSFSTKFQYHCIICFTFVTTIFNIKLKFSMFKFYEYQINEIGSLFYWNVIIWKHSLLIAWLY